MIDFLVHFPRLAAFALIACPAIAIVAVCLLDAMGLEFWDNE